MRRFAALVLTCLLALQAGWAVAASYCQHESQRDSASAVAHFGHHTHQHPVADAKADAGVDAPGTPLPDLDCHACHASQASVTPAPLAFGAAPAAAAPPQRADEALPAPPRARRERPNWQSLA